MSKTLEVLGVQVTVVPVYRCRECGTNARGVSAQLAGATYDGALRQPVLNNHMPIGWASYGSQSGWEYACPEHVK
jgi:hypothetical protein